MMRFILILFVITSPFCISSQNVGLNTNLPQFTLDVRGLLADDASVLQLATPSEDHFLRMFAGRPGDPNPFIQWKNGDPLRFATDAGAFSFEERMRLTSAGRLGLGVVDPLAMLHIHHPVNASLHLETNTIADVSELLLINGDTSGIHTHYFLRNSSDRLRILVRSDLLLGVTEEIANLNYQGDLQIDGGLMSGDLQGVGTRELYTDGSGALTTDGPAEYITVNATAFKPDDNSSAYLATGTSVVGGDGTNTRLYAPIQLPHGKTIKEILFRYRDLSTENIYISLRSAGVTGGGNSVVHSFTSSGTPNATVYTSPELTIPVNNQSFSYYIDIAPAIGDTWDSGFLALYSFRVKVE